jgi:hypothetical protein
MARTGSHGARAWNGSRPWAPALPAFAAAAVLFWSFARPQAWMLAGGQCVTLADGSLRATWPGSRPLPDLGGIPIIGSLFGPQQARPANWWFVFDFNGPSPGVAVPLWAPVLVLGLAGAASHRRLANACRCAGCGYDLRGLALAEDGGVRCPECGLCAPADAPAPVPFPDTRRL